MKKPPRKKKTRSPAGKTGPSAHEQAESALVIFAKAPVPGQVKTRLCPPVTDDEAATLQGSLVLDVLERSRLGPHVARFIAGAPNADHTFFKVQEARERVQLLDQGEGNLGTRMNHAFEALFARGFRRIVLIGTDVPTLSKGLLQKAFDLLKTHDLVLGPARDGGYFLIGLTKPVPDLFAEIPWSTDQVLEITQRKADQLGLKTASLPTHRDLDTLEDLQQLIETVTTGAAPPAGDASNDLMGPISSRTAGVLRTLGPRLRSRPAAPPADPNR